MKSNLLLFIYLLLRVMLLSQNHTGVFPPSEIAPEVKAYEIKVPITLDGKLEEYAWSQATVYDHFFRLEPRQGGEVKFPTKVKVMYDAKNLYIGAFNKDTSLRKGIRVIDLKRDFTFSENENFYVAIDGQNTKRYCMVFSVTPYGNMRDAQVFDDTFRDGDWDALWRVKTHITDTGWYAEYAIPLSTLRYERPIEGQENIFGISFSRLARREYEQSSFPPVPQSFSPQRMDYAARLTGLKLPPPSINFRVQPYTLVQRDKTTNASNKTSTTTSIKPGGEIKWATNTHSILDFTFNTDFAQADVDRAVNNLTRFNVFFPERRQFFLENSGVYAGADIDDIKPFFSRSIGLANAQFNADPVPIDAGVRYTDRTDKRTIAGLYVHQRGTEKQAASNFGVARYLQNYGKQNNIGAMITHRVDESNVDKGLKSKNNTTYTIDGLNRPIPQITIQYLASVSQDSENNSTGAAGSLFLGWFPQNWYWGTVSKMVSERYLPGMGYVFGQNIIHHNPGGYYIWRPKKGWWSTWIRRQDPGFFINWYQNAHDLSTQEINLYLFPIYVFTKRNAFFEYSYTPTWQKFNAPFTILGRTISKGNYRTANHTLRFNSDRSKKISTGLKFESGGYYNGRLQQWTADLKLSPIPHIYMEGNFEHNLFKNFGLLKQNFKTQLYSLGVRLAASPKLQLSSFYQYNTFDQRSRINLRGSWEFSPLSFLYLVFNENSLRNSPEGNQSSISKISYLKQF